MKTTTKLLKRDFQFKLLLRLYLLICKKTFVHNKSMIKIRNPKTGRMVKKDGEVGKQVLGNAATIMQKIYRGKKVRNQVIQKVFNNPIQKVFNNPNLRKIIITKAGNATKKDAGIQNFNGRMIHNETLKVLPNWMIPKKDSKSNALDAWKSKMKKQTYTSEKRKDLNDIKDLFLSLEKLKLENNLENYYNLIKYKNANNTEKSNMISEMLYDVPYNKYDEKEIYENGVLRKSPKFKRIVNIIPKLIYFNNGQIKTTNLGKLYYKFILNIPLNKSDEYRFFHFVNFD